MPGKLMFGRCRNADSPVCGAYELGVMAREVHHEPHKACGMLDPMLQQACVAGFHGQKTFNVWLMKAATFSCGANAGGNANIGNNGNLGGNGNIGGNELGGNELEGGNAGGNLVNNGTAAMRRSPLLASPTPVRPIPTPVRPIPTPTRFVGGDQRRAIMYRR